MVTPWPGRRRDMRPNRTRKGKPPQRNEALIQATREVAARMEMAKKVMAAPPTQIHADVIDVPLEEADAKRES
jgi:hypothetical protein